MKLPSRYHLQGLPDPDDVAKFEASAGDTSPAEAIVTAIIKDVCELDGYTSPDDNPELLQCTVKELDLILRRHLLGQE